MYVDNSVHNEEVYIHMCTSVVLTYINQSSRKDWWSNYPNLQDKDQYRILMVDPGWPCPPCNYSAGQKFRTFNAMNFL